MLLTTAIGNDPSTSIAMRLVDLEVPAAFVATFPGPRFGIAGWRAITGIDDRPLLLNMIKPCTGFPPEVGAGFAAESARGGVDLIKDDELLADPIVQPGRRADAGVCRGHRRGRRGDRPGDPLRRPCDDHAGAPRRDGARRGRRRRRGGHGDARSPSASMRSPSSRRTSACRSSPMSPASR